ncbi:unnamed protein product [Didymodactylos carnosus]|uniref:SHSP domain-containing protein n=1 Tax=Didymodactylos carnosus TaxID=1234261 RepID=A0A814SCC5_9BILA|nr:unnamed protein product [Didymodactylos carnosus]CAF1144499.1 unnamed protein product [Didymodactylos carnosus]CAF3705538.1 unnamed protein product [Didymodactylos carnosus]CAF3908149.1 unnamed protein product [Didymodactylos carnosus]
MKSYSKSKSHESRYTSGNVGDNSSSIYDQSPFDINRDFRTNAPVQHLNTHSPSHLLDRDTRVSERVQNSNFTTQWIKEPVKDSLGNILSTNEKFRITVNIEGFRQDEVNIRIDGNKLIVSGKHMENKDESSAEKRIEKSYELPRDVDPFSPHVMFPSLTTMQIDFPARQQHTPSNSSGGHLANIDDSLLYHHHRQPKITQETHTSEYSRTRKIGGTSGTTSSRYKDRSLSPKASQIHREPLVNINTGNYATSSSSTSHYRAGSDHDPPYSDSSARQISADSLSTHDDSKLPQNFSNISWADTRKDDYSLASPYTSLISPRITSNIRERSRSPSYTSNISTPNSKKNVETFSETRREQHVRRTSPTSGTKASHEFEHQQSGSPSTQKYYSSTTQSTPSTDNDNYLSNRFKTGVNLDRYPATPTSTLHYEPLSHRNNDGPSRNVEVREYSRRLAGNEPISTTPGLINSEGFNADAFYKSAFQPEIYYDQQGQRGIEMKLDVQNFEPEEIKVTMDGQDLIVQAEHDSQRSSNHSSRSYIYKQITLPPNADITSLSSEYNADKKLYIRALLKDDKSSLVKHK